MPTRDLGMNRGGQDEIYATLTFSGPLKRPAKSVSWNKFLFLTALIIIDGRKVVPMNGKVIVPVPLDGPSGTI